MRLFFALWPPPPVAEKLAAQAGMLAQRHGGKATRRETIHLTLAFLGETEEARLADIIRAARAVHAKAFELDIDRVGYWRHNRLLWAGCRMVPEELPALAKSLQEKLRAASIAFDDSHGFVPHVTLVRKVSDTAMPGGIQRDLPASDPLLWTCNSFSLVHSQQSQAGQVYRVAAEFPLAKADGPPHA